MQAPDTALKVVGEAMLRKRIREQLEVPCGTSGE
jgi:hypothetical protein